METTLPQDAMPELDLHPDVVLGFEGASIFVLGDLMLDQYLAGSVDRVSPEAPVPIVLAGDERTVLGGAANVAANIGALGCTAIVCGIFGDDVAGDRLATLCQDAGVTLDTALRKQGVPTTLKQRVVSGSQQLLRIDRERWSPADDQDVARVVQRIELLAEEGLDGVVISDYAKGTVTPSMARAVVAVARRLGLPVVVDPKGTALDHYSGATVVKPNLAEAKRMAGSANGKPDGVEELTATLHGRTDVDNFVVSMAADGVVLAPRGGTVERFGTRAREVSDVSGAGDTMIATIASSLASGLSIRVAVQLGNVAAGLACAKFGTALVTAAEIFNEIVRLTLPAESPHIVQDWQRLSRLVELRRNAGARIVFANGCFDLLHRGHVSLLEEARAQGDVLVVGLNSDESVQRLKGPTRPLQSLADRLTVMAAVRFVDYATAFEQDTPIDLIRAIRPDVIVKGGDYTADDVVGAPEVKEWGGRVHIVNLVDGLSTTKLVSAT
ncbi:MAG: D-glycero-beta-D-manno-heptose 1-phosphate adenylyltransferase [Labedaea sp.]